MNSAFSLKFMIKKSLLKDHFSRTAIIVLTAAFMLKKPAIYPCSHVRIEALKLK